jgi:hypothetical protein
MLLFMKLLDELTRCSFAELFVLLGFIAFVSYMYRDHCVKTEILMNMSFLVVTGLAVSLALITLLN